MGWEDENIYIIEWGGKMTAYTLLSGWEDESIYIIEWVGKMRAYTLLSGVGR